MSNVIITTRDCISVPDIAFFFAIACTRFQQTRHRNGVHRGARYQYHYLKLVQWMISMLRRRLMLLHVRFCEEAIRMMTCTYFATQLLPSLFSCHLLTLYLVCYVARVACRGIRWRLTESLSMTIARARFYLFGALYNAQTLSRVYFLCGSFSLVHLLYQMLTIISSLKAFLII